MNPPENKLDKTISSESDNAIENNTDINRQQIKTPLMSENIDISFEVDSSNRKISFSQTNLYQNRKRTLTYTLQNNPSYQARLKMNSQDRQKTKQKYNPFKSPPDIEFAKKHGKSRRVCKKIDLNNDDQQGQKETCLCCGYQVDNEQFEICTDPNNFAHLGTCFPLYFNFVKQCFAFICLQFFIQGLPSLIINYNAIDESEKCKGQSFICFFSFLNLMNSSNYDAIKIESILNFVTIIIQLFVLEFFKIYQKSLKVYLEKDRVTVSDYSVMFQKLPLDITTQQIEEYLEESCQGSKENIVRIFMLYDIEKYTQNYQRQQKLYKQNLAIQHQINTISTNEKLSLQQKEKIIEKYTRDSTRIQYEILRISKDKRNLEKTMKREIIQENNPQFVNSKLLRQNTGSSDNIDELTFNLNQKSNENKQLKESLNINKIKQSTDNENENFSSNENNLYKITKQNERSFNMNRLNSSEPAENDSLIFSGNAIVTFNNYETRKQVQRTLKPKTYSEYFYTQVNRFCITWCKRRYDNIIAENKLKRFILKNRLVRLEKAPEPSDILWTNIGSIYSKIKLRIQSYVVVYFLLFTVCLLLALLKYFIQDISDNFQESVSQVWVIALTLAGSSAVAGGNVIIGMVIRNYTSKEKRKTQTEYFVNTGNKLTNMFAVNMILTTIFSNITTYFALTNNDGTTPLNMQNIINTYFFLFITNSYLSSLFSIFDIVWGYRLWRRWRIINSEKVRNTTTQEEANQVFEDHPVDMALRYANILKNVQFTCAVSPLIPLGVPMCLVGLLIIYWVDKYLLTRRWVCSNFLQHVLSKEMLKQMNMAVVYFSLGNMLTMFMPTTKDISQDGEQNYEWEWPNLFQSGFFYLAVLGVVIAVFVNYSPFKKASLYSIYNRCTNQDDYDTKRHIDETYIQIKSEIQNLDDYDHYHPVYKNYTKRHIDEIKMSQDRSDSIYQKSNSTEKQLKDKSVSLQFFDDMNEENKQNLENYIVFSNIQQSIKNDINLNQK